ncbi:MAG: aconitate hydratase, partial [Ardenticatenia bacterium]|nr:aconitate hydratase [Ardenticatenia bacterium]
MKRKATDFFGARAIFDTGSGTAHFYRLHKLEDDGLGAIARLPFSIKVLLESVLRQCDGDVVTQDDVANLAGWSASSSKSVEMPFKPARVIMQDLTAVPALVDLAAMRSAMARMGGDPRKINPVVPVDLVIDHSLQVDAFGSATAFSQNTEFEFDRNRERYGFLRWGQQAFDNFRVMPPASGIVHQVNLEYIANGVQTCAQDGDTVVFPDSVIGTDSHTPMINGLGIVGWGVGGIEAEAVMLGQPLYMPTPEVIGFRLTGQLREGATATDLALTITQMLRQKGVVGKFVEYCGPGLSSMSLPDRATIANMAPDYGATMGFFPMDEESIRYLRQTGRPRALVTMVERYAREQDLFWTSDTPEPDFTDILELDLGTAEPSLAGPKRPQDRIPLGRMKQPFTQTLQPPRHQQGYGLSCQAPPARSPR